MQTKSSRYFSVSFPPELIEKLREFAASESLSVPYVIRHACIEHLSAHGFDVSSIPNPSGRGERTDLAHERPAVADSPHRPPARSRRTSS